MDAVLSRFRSEYAMNNREEIDGFLAVLICSPDIAKPSEYLTEIYGGKMTHDEAVADREQLLDFWGLLTRITPPSPTYPRTFNAGGSSKVPRSRQGQELVTKPGTRLLPAAPDGAPRLAGIGGVQPQTLGRGHAKQGDARQAAQERQVNDSPPLQRRGQGDQGLDGEAPGDEPGRVDTGRRQHLVYLGASLTAISERRLQDGQHLCRGCGTLGAERSPSHVAPRLRVRS